MNPRYENLEEPDAQRINLHTVVREHGLLQALSLILDRDADE